MPGDDEREDNKNRLGVFLKVERAEGGYIETDLKGGKTRYYKHTWPESIELENIKVSRSVDPRTGVARSSLTAITKAKFRAIGAETAYQIFYVIVSSDFPAGTAVVRFTYGLQGHPHRQSLEVGANETALKEIVDETRHAPSTRNLDIQLKEPSFFATHPDASYDGLDTTTYLLQPWSERPQEKGRVDQIDPIAVTWTFEVSSVDVCPEIRHSLSRGERDPQTSTVVAETKIRGGVGVHYRPAGDVDDDDDFMSKYFERVVNAVESLRPALYLIGIAIALLALKFVL